MKSTVPRGGALALTLACVAATGCGGSDGIDRARYVRDADAICKAAQAKAASGGQPLSMYELSRRLKTSHRALLDGARRLRALRDDIAGEPSPEVVAFQRRVQPVVSMTMTLADDAEFGDREAVRRHAERLRGRGAKLYAAAQAADLKSCGRGGNRAADRALFVTYRVGFLEKIDEAALQTTLATNGADKVQSAGEFVSALDGYLKGIRSFRENLAFLAPPRDLRPAHRALKRHLSALLRLGADLRASFQGLPAGRAETLATLNATAAAEKRAARAEKRMRRMLTPKRGGRV